MKKILTFVILLLLMTVACKESKLQKMHRLAKENHIHCYVIYMPGNIAGPYCLMHFDEDDYHMMESLFDYFEDVEEIK